MKKLLIFLVLIGIGIGVLWWLDPSAVPVHLEQASKPDQPLAAEELPSEEPIAPQEVAPVDQDAEPQGMIIRGQVEARWYSEQTDLLKMLLLAQSSESTIKFDKLKDVRIDLYNATEEQLDLEADSLGIVTADLAEMARSDMDGGSTKHPRQVRLENLRADLEGNQELTDLNFEAPDGVVDLADDFQTIFSMESGVQIHSKELEAHGEVAQITTLNTAKLSASQSEETKLQFIELDGDSGFKFKQRQAPGSTALQIAPQVEVSSQGSLSLNRIDRSSSKTRTFEARENAHLTLTGLRASSLKANHILGWMFEAPETGTLLLKALQADGEVSWKHFGHHLQGQRMDLSADAKGQPVEVTLKGFPSLLLQLGIPSSNIDQVTPTDPKQLASDQLFIRSDSRIKMERTREQLRATIVGPVSVESRSILLRSAGDLVLELPYDFEALDSAPRKVKLRATGGVVLELLPFGDQRYSKLECAELNLSLGARNDGQPLDFTCTALGGSKLEGVLVDKRPFTVDTPHSLLFERQDSELEIRNAREITIDVRAVEGAEEGSSSAEALQASCMKLSKFNLNKTQISASGGILVSNSMGAFNGRRIESKGARYLEVWGGAQKQVNLASKFGRADADYIKVTEGFFQMKGQVAASLVGLPNKEELQAESRVTRLDVSSDELEIKVLESQFQRIYDCLAKGSVQSEVSGKERGVELHHADQIHIQRTDLYQSPDKSGSALDSSVELSALGNVHTHVELGTGSFELWTDAVDLIQRHAAEGSNDPEVVARGSVRFAGSWLQPTPGEDPLIEKTAKLLQNLKAISFNGNGDRLEIFPEGSALLSAQKSKRVQLRGLLPLKSSKFELSAIQAKFGPQNLDALEPVIQIAPELYEISAARLIASKTSIDLRGRTKVAGVTPDGKAWSLEADKVELKDSTSSKAKPGSGVRGLLAVIEAEGSVHFVLDQRVEAFADLLRRDALGLSMSGSPCLISNRYGAGAGTQIQSEWIHFDMELEVVTEMGSGSISSFLDEKDPTEDWKIEFLSFRTEFDQDSILFFLEEPFFTKTNAGHTTTLRSSYSVIWVPSTRWKEFNILGLSASQKGDSSKAERVDIGAMDVFFNFIESQGIVDLVNEIYFEGPVQTCQDGNLVSHADAVYLDVRSGRGWLTGVTLNIIGSFLGRENEAIRVKADWLRHAKDGSLTADRATLTPCDYDKPHVRVVTGELKLSPTVEDDEPGYSISMRSNGIEFYDLFELPLPPLEFNTDEKLKPQFPSFSFGNSTRFGQLFSVRFTQPARRLGKFFYSLFGSNDAAESTEIGASTPAPRRKKPYHSKYDIDASYLSSRGALLDVGFSIKENNDKFWLEWINGLVLDGGRDRGYVRVPKDDRGNLRLWIRSQGQLKFNKNTLGFSFSDQSDPAVQSEFYESGFTRYEQDETYVQWKRRNNNRWFQASAQTRIDSFRAGIEELPSLNAFSGRAPLFKLGNTSFIHSGEIEASYLRRLTPRRFDLNNDGIAESVLTSPFASNGSYSDTLGAQDVIRTTTRQVLETPFALGTLGLKLTPFATFHGAYWDNAVDQAYAARLVGDVGVRLSTVMWKRNSDNSLHEFTPFIEYRNDVVNRVNGRPLELGIDERALFADFVQVGSRARFDVRDNHSLFDLDLRGTYATNRSDGGPDGWLPIEIYSRLGIKPRNRTFDIWYDGRFDVEQNESIYSHFSLGTRLLDDYGIQIGYQTGRDPALVKIFDTASISGFYRWTDKWEFEARQSFSLLEDQQLGFEMVLRRYGHDLIFELESKLREGEGSAIGFSIRPRLGFKPNRIGYTNW